MTAFNQLSHEEAERLALLLEECGEVQQAIGKILRHGYESLPPSGGDTNRESLARELGDVLCAIDLLVAGGDLAPRHFPDKELVSMSHNSLQHYREAKGRRVGQFLHHQKFPPT